MEVFTLIWPYLMWTLVSIGGSISIAYLGVLVYDELTSRTNDLYELMLTVAVAVEYLLRGGRPKSKSKYEGRHRVAEEFINGLVDEMRVRPGSLCYDKKLARAIRMRTPRMLSR